MDKKELQAKKEDFQTKVDIRIKVMSDGMIHIEAPENLFLFREVLRQANRIMSERYPEQAQQLDNMIITDERKKIVLAN